MAQYSDAEMLLAAQISYMNIEPGQNVAKAIEATLRDYENSRFWSEEWWQYQWALSAKKIIDDNRLESYTDWTIADVCNHENGSGYYGCLIDMGDGNAIIGCRGSEQYDWGQVGRDWGVADLGLLNSSLTTQQADATEYMRYIYENFGDKYGNFSITGHSLGGNLAEHCAVTAPEGMRDKIDHVINYDGPGYSDEYIEAHLDDIARVSDKIDHYQHSWVGSFLNPLPGVGRQVINAQDDPRLPGILGSFLRHDASNIRMVGGYVQPGEEDNLQNFFGPLSRFLDEEGPEVFLVVPGLLSPGLGLTLYSISKTNQIVSGLVEGVIRNYYDKYYAHQVSGEFEVNLSSLQVFPDELESVAGRSEDIADDIRTIVSSLKYHSISGAYYKNKLRRIARNIEKVGQYARNSGNILSDVINLYSTRDADVAASYT